MSLPPHGSQPFGSARLEPNCVGVTYPLDEPNDTPGPAKRVPPAEGETGPEKLIVVANAAPGAAHRTAMQVARTIEGAFIVASKKLDALNATLSLVS